MSNEEPWVYDSLKWATDNGYAHDDEAYTQVVIEEGHVLHEPIINLLRSEGQQTYHRAPMYLVTEERWSGYSEYTITSTWTEVHVHYGDVDLHFNDMGEFMRRLSDANPPGPLS